VTVGVTVRVVDPAFTSVTVHVKIWLLPAVNVTVLLGEVSVKLKAAPPSLSEATTLAKGIVDVPPPLFVTFIDNVAVELTVDAGKLMLVVPMPLLAELPLKVATDITSLEVVGGTVVDPKFAVISVDTANTSELTAIMHKNMQVANAIAALVAFFISDFSPLMLTLRSQQKLGQKRYWRMQRSFLQELLNFFIFQI